MLTFLLDLLHRTYINTSVALLNSALQPSFGRFLPRLGPLTFVGGFFLPEALPGSVQAQFGPSPPQSRFGIERPATRYILLTRQIRSPYAAIEVA